MCIRDRSKIVRVKVEIQADASKQIKVVTESMSDPLFDQTLDASPTENVFESDLEESNNINENKIEIKYIFTN